MAGVTVRRSPLLNSLQRLLKARRHIIVLFIANLVLGWFATFGLSSRIGAVTGPSLISERMVRGFDLGAFFELINKPEVALKSQVPFGLVFSAMFIVLQLFLTGGIVTQYLAAEHLDRGRFYAACGEHFWKMVRVAILTALVTAVVAAVFYGFRALLSSALKSEGSGAFMLQSAVLLVEALVLLWVRMWFDLAQTQLVSTGASRVRSNVAHGFKSARAIALYASYALIALLMLIGTAFGVFVWWTASPASEVALSFLILQSTLAWLLGLRWWQRALAAEWHQRNLPVTTTIEAPLLQPLPPESAVPEVPLAQ